LGGEGNKMRARLSYDSCAPRERSVAGRSSLGRRRGRRDRVMGARPLRRWQGRSRPADGRRPRVKRSPFATTRVSSNGNGRRGRATGWPRAATVVRPSLLTSLAIRCDPLNGGVVWSCSHSVPGPSDMAGCWSCWSSSWGCSSAGRRAWHLPFPCRLTGIAGPPAPPPGCRNTRQAFCSTAC